MSHSPRQTVPIKHHSYPTLSNTLGQRRSLVSPAPLQALEAVGIYVYKLAKKMGAIASNQILSTASAVLCSPVLAMSLPHELLVLWTNLLGE